MPLDVCKRLDFGINFFDFEGEGDNVSVDGVFEKMLEDIEDAPKIVLDFERLQFCNSKFLGNLFFFVDQVTEKKGKLCIVGINQGIIDTFEVVGIFDMIPRFENLQEALTYLNE